MIQHPPTDVATLDHAVGHMDACGLDETAHGLPPSTFPCVTTRINRFTPLPEVEGIATQAPFNGRYGLHLATCVRLLSYLGNDIPRLLHEPLELLQFNTVRGHPFKERYELTALLVALPRALCTRGTSAKPTATSGSASQIGPGPTWASAQR